MQIRQFYEWTRKKSIEEKLELIYQNAWWMSCNAYHAAEAREHRNTEVYKYEESERYAMRERIRYLCWQIMQDIDKEKNDGKFDRKAQINGLDV